MLHYTNQNGWNSIRSQLNWLFRAQQPPGDHPLGAYFTTLPPSTRNLAKKLRIPRRLGECVPTIASLQSLGKTNSYKLDAFLEALVSLRTSEMIAAAWRIIQGMQVEKIEMQFEYWKSFALRISLLSPYGENENYSTNDIDDMNFLSTFD